VWDLFVSFIKKSYYPEFQASYVPTYEITHYHRLTATIPIIYLRYAIDEMNIIHTTMIRFILLIHHSNKIREYIYATTQSVYMCTPTQYSKNIVIIVPISINS